MLLLGLSDSHDASVTLIEDGKVLAAVSEERFTRRKRQQGFPYNSLRYIMSIVGEREIGKVYMVGKYGRAVFRIMDNFYRKGDPAKNILSFSVRIVSKIENTITSLPWVREIESILGLGMIKRRLKLIGLKYGSIELLDHHYAHIASALSGMDSDNYLAVSLDAYGDGKSGLVVNVVNRKVVEIKRISYKNSIALFYAYISAYLGFNEGEEGKVMALAGYGTKSELLNEFRKIFKVNQAEIKVSSRYKKWSFKKLIKNESKEDVCYALQKTVEEVVLEFIKASVVRNTKPDLFLAGGLFANISINQRLHESKIFSRIFIFPNMGDGGTVYLPSIDKMRGGNSAELGDKRISELKSVYLGPAYTDVCIIKSILEAEGLVYSEEADIEKKIAKLLAAGKTVARFNGRMEYGPRALGNRSILYQTTDVTVNDWLNKKLKRVNFMPFAPVTLFELKDQCYLNIEGAENAVKFMTIAVDCTDLMKKVSPGVVHADGTARPQLLREEDNPSYYQILKEYYQLTGIPSLINTSFNMHGEPIVCSPQEAIETFKTAKIDYLAISKFLVKAS